METFTLIGDFFLNKTKCNKDDMISILFLIYPLIL